MFGLEETLGKEISQLGGQNVSIKKRAVEFDGDKELLYKSNYKLKTALRILMPILKFSFKSKKDYFNFIYRFNWSKYIDENQTIAINAVCHSRFFNHSKYLAQFTKDGIADYFVKKTGKRPSVDLYNPDIALHVLVHEDQAEVSLSTSGFSLHKRSYRKEKVDAPINEVLASGIIQLSGWDRKTDLIDPMCGSGTLAFEAAILARDIPLHVGKHFCFHNWKDYDKQLDAKVQEQAKDEMKPQEVKIYGSDKSFAAISSCRINEKTITEANITFEKNDFFLIEDHPAKFLVMNPPYDLRLKSNDIISFYKRIGDALKQNWKPCEAWIFSGNIDAIKAVGLKPSRKINLMNGQLPSKLHKFEVYEGSRRHN